MLARRAPGVLLLLPGFASPCSKCGLMESAQMALGAPVWGGNGPLLRRVPGPLHERPSPLCNCKKVGKTVCTRNVTCWGRPTEMQNIRAGRGAKHGGGSGAQGGLQHSSGQRCNRGRGSNTGHQGACRLDLATPHDASRNSRPQALPFPALTTPPNPVNDGAKQHRGTDLHRGLVGSVRLSVWGHVRDSKDCAPGTTDVGLQGLGQLST